MNQWVDISGGDQYPLDKDYGEDLPPMLKGGYGNLFWFDEPSGRLFLKYRYLSPRFNALCITYRYGSQEPVPSGIKRLCNLIVASNIITMDFYMVKVGMGGDISGLRDQALRRWDDECARLYSAYQRSGSVHSLYR